MNFQATDDKDSQQWIGFALVELAALGMNAAQFDDLIPDPRILRR
jgi:hypothetical protein